MSIANDADSLDGLERLHLIMGLQCNVRCTMCYQTDFSPKFNMPAEIYRERLQPAWSRVKSVKLQGGEPTVMKNCREAALVLREFPQAKITLITNGVLIDEFWHETIVEQAGNVSISINAGTKEAYDKIVIHGEWERVIRNLERILRDRRGKTPSVGLNIVILKENFHTLHDLIELCGRMGVDYLEIVIDPLLSFSGLPDRAAMVRELELCRNAQARWNLEVSGLSNFSERFALPVSLPKADLGAKPMCTAPFRNLVIDWNGDVRVCCNTWVKIGNLHQSSLQEVFQAEKARRFRHKMEKGDYIWCSPSCVDNANPTRLALAHKYVYEASQDPELFAKKVKQKVEQLQGEVRFVRKRTGRLGDPKRAGYEVRQTVVAETTPGSTGKVRLPIVAGDG